LIDFVFGSFAERTTENSEVLRKYCDLAALNGSNAGHYRVTVGARFVHAEGRGAVSDELVKLFKEPGSSNISMRSRAVFLPLACCFAIAASPGSINGFVVSLF
jgi:hypothetical protein